MFPAWLSKVLRSMGGASLILLLCVACVHQPALSNRSRPSITIGVSLSLSGAFAAQGEALARGYQLWADYVNRHGGLLGHSVQLVISSDASHEDQAASNYMKLINTDHVALVFGPDSTRWNFQLRSLQTIMDTHW